MCYGCIRCGKCRPKEDPLLREGECPVCGQRNPQNASKCSNCGMPIPLIPGKSNAAIRKQKS